ncbi:MAG: prepilin peptidase [Candidatus Saganbacteria bacterium]|nr:prepilin peptidase [Candidatus Saganbacteria bacterium]
MTYLFLFILGAVVGSFLNVCIHRLPRRESVVFPPSHCPQCNARLASVDLVPLVSYFRLRGRCRHCGAPISGRYPLIEALSGLLLAAAWWGTGGSWFDFFFWALFLSALLVLAFIDLEHQLLPDAVSLVGLICGLLYNSWRGEFFTALAGLALGFAILWAISFLGKLIYRKDVLGEGDWLLGAFLGAYLGWQQVIVAIFLAYMLAALVAVVLIVRGKARLEHYIPFAPALASGGTLSLFWGHQLIGWYLWSLAR